MSDKRHRAAVPILVLMMFISTKTTTEASDQWFTHAHDYARTSATTVAIGEPCNVELVWKMNTTRADCRFNNVTVADGKVFCSDGQTVHGYDLLTGALHWTYYDPAGIATASGMRNNLTYSDGTVYGAGGSAQSFFKLNAVTGALIWSRHFNSMGGGTGDWLCGQQRFGVSAKITANGTDDIIIFGDEGGCFWALEDGTGLNYPGWLTNPIDLGAAIYHSPVYPGGDYTYVATNGGVIYKVNIHNGTYVLIFVEPDGDPFYSGCSYDSTEGVIYAASSRGGGGGDTPARYKIDTTGNLIWSFSQGPTLYAPPTIGSDRVYFAQDSPDSGILIVDKSTGLVIHDFAADGVGMVTNPVTLSGDGYMFAGDRQGNWHLLDVTNLRKVWTRHFQDYVWGTALVQHPSDGNTYAVMNIWSDAAIGYQRSAVFAWRFDADPRPMMDILTEEFEVFVPMEEGPGQIHFETEALLNYSNCADLQITGFSLLDPGGGILRTSNVQLVPSGAISSGDTVGLIWTWDATGLPYYGDYETIEIICNDPDYFPEYVGTGLKPSIVVNYFPGWLTPQEYGPRGSTVPTSTNVAAYFYDQVNDEVIDEATVDALSFVVYDQRTGLRSGSFDVQVGISTSSIEFNPDGIFNVGEHVTVILTDQIRSTSGFTMKPFSWSFTTAVDTGYGTFADQIIYSAGDGTHDIISADLNNDGHLDLVAPNENVDNVSVFINNGDGTFAAHVTYAVGDLPLRVCAADLDHDGNLDLATANHLSHNVSVLLNNGDGTFGTQTVYAVGTNPRSVCAADLDNDGDIDLAVPNQISGDVSILLNNGDATFAGQMTYPAGNETLYLAAGDLDSDGDVDLVTADFAANTVSVLSNNGNGTFGSPTAYPVGNKPYYVSTADLNADGHLDLAVPNSVSNDISILLNNGDGTLLPQMQYGAGVLPQSALASDLDGDGDLDLTVVNADADNLLVLLNNGDGTFSSGPEYPVGDFPYSVCTADLDGDGDLDLAVANRDSDDISVLFNAPAPHVLSTTPEPNALSISKFNAISVSFDTEIDMATVDSGSFSVNGSMTGHHDGAFGFDVLTKTLTIDPDDHFTAGEVITITLTSEIRSADGVRLNAGYSWSFVADVVFGVVEFDPQTVYPAGDGAHGVFAARLDQDDDIDLVVANPYAQNVMIYLNDGTGTFGTSSSFGTGSVPYAVCGSDFDMDGDIDLVTVNNTSNDLSVLLNNGDGSFATHVTYPTESQPRDIYTADLNNDGNMDILVANDVAHTASVLRGNGDGTFATQVVYPVGNNPWAVIAADLNGDGFADMVTANTGSDDISVLLNNGYGTLNAAVSYPTGDEPRSLYAGDLNADGNLDLVTANDNGDDISVLINDGSAVFAPPISYPAGTRPTSVSGGDLDGDDDLDLVVTAADSDSIIVLLNDGAGIFSVDSMYQAGTSPHSIVAADLDNDDDLDLAVANWESDNLSVFINTATCDCSQHCDLNLDGFINPVDVVYMVNFVYRGLDARMLIPTCPGEQGDWDCNGGLTNPVDVVYYVSFVYRSTGDGPCDPCAE